MILCIIALNNKYKLMKKIVLFTFFLACTSLFAQLEYTLTKSTATYTNLTSPTSLTTNAWAGEAVFRLPAGMRFKFFGKPYDTVHVAASSGIFFSYNPSNTDLIFFGTETYYAQDNTPSKSPVSYIVTGLAPERVIKIEFRNFYGILSDTSEDYIVNNQIWLYEANNLIEYHFGGSVITDVNSNEFYIGLIDYDNSPYLAIDGTAANPTLVRVTSVGSFDGIATHPLNGQVYTLTPKTVSVNRLTKPYGFAQGDNSFRLNSEEPANIGVYDISGKLVETIEHVPGQMLRHQFSNISAGIYMVNIVINNVQFTEKILIQ
jgi:hypothetical protein